jgi:hypothetical protein
VSCCIFYIGKRAFSESSLRSILIPVSVEFIGKHCFQGYRFLYEIIFQSGSSLKEIRDCAFFETNLEEIELPEKCEFISGLSVLGVKKVSINEANQTFQHVVKVVYAHI